MRKQQPIAYKQVRGKAPRWTPKATRPTPEPTEPDDEPEEEEVLDYPRLVTGLLIGGFGLFLSGLMLMFADKFDPTYSKLLVGAGFIGLYKFGALFGYFHHRLFD